LRQAVRGAGTTATSGSHPILLLQGSCVGGSTAVNSGIIWRLPEDVRKVWIEKYGLRELVDDSIQNALFDRIEQELEVAETAEHVWGENNRLMARASEALGLPGKPTSRNAARCRGSSQCLLGCPSGARQSMDVSYIPHSIESGARLY